MNSRHTDLEKKIASALADTIKSADVVALIEEVEAAANAAEQAAKEAHARSLDPTVADPAAAREAQREAEFTTERLDAAMPRLDARLAEIRKAEDLERWHSACDAREVERDALAAELREVYQDFETKIPDLFARIAANDEQLSNLHQARAAGVSRHLFNAEMVARGLESFGRDNPSLATELRLPSWDQPTKLAWPPPKPSEAAAFAASMAVPMHRGADWWRDGAARAAEQAAEAKRVSDHYAEQARLRDEHEAAEERARIAKARR